MLLDFFFGVVCGSSMMFVTEFNRLYGERKFSLKTKDYGTFISLNSFLRMFAIMRMVIQAFFLYNSRF